MVNIRAVTVVSSLSEDRSGKIWRWRWQAAAACCLEVLVDFFPVRIMISTSVTFQPLLKATLPGFSASAWSSRQSSASIFRRSFRTKLGWHKTFLRRSLHDLWLLFAPVQNQSLKRNVDLLGYRSIMSETECWGWVSSAADLFAARAQKLSEKRWCLIDVLTGTPLGFPWYMR